MPKRKRNLGGFSGWRGATGTPCQSAVRSEGFLKLPGRGRDSTRTEWLELQRIRPGLFRRRGLPPDELADVLNTNEDDLWRCLMDEVKSGKRARSRVELSDEELSEQELQHHRGGRMSQRQRAELEGWKPHRVTVWEKPGAPGVWTRSSKSVSRRAGIRINPKGDHMKITLPERLEPGGRALITIDTTKNPTMKTRRSRTRNPFGDMEQVRTKTKKPRAVSTLAVRNRHKRRSGSYVHGRCGHRIKVKPGEHRIAAVGRHFRRFHKKKASRRRRNRAPVKRLAFV